MQNKLRTLFVFVFYQIGFGGAEMDKLMKSGLNNVAGALLAERIDLLTGEAHQQAVLLLVLRHIFDDFGARL